MGDNFFGVEPFVRGFLSSASDYIGKKIADGFYKMACETPVFIDPGDIFAGLHKKEIGIYYYFGSGISVNEEFIDDKIKNNPEFAAELTEMKNAMIKLSASRLSEESRDEAERAAAYNMSCWGGVWGGHSNPDYGLLASVGTDGLREKAERYKKANPGKDEYYESIIVTLNAVDKFAERLSEKAGEMSLGASPDDQKKLLRIAETLAVVPKKPSYDFFSACQAFWLAFTFDGIDSPGRFDQFMYPFYLVSDKNDRRYCLEALWRLFHKTRAWNLCISGSDEFFNDETNELSYEILEVAQKYKYQTPNITMRVHRNTPEKLYEKAAEVLAGGIGMPALYNDETVCNALEALNIPTADSHDYCMNGCNQIDIMGKSHMGLEDGEVSLIKCLEYALFDGVCQITGERVGLKTGDAEEFITFNDLYSAYKKQVEYVTDLCINMANKSQKIFADYAPNPYRSALLEGCVESGTDYKSGGALYNHGQVLAEGIADTADSLAAIKHFAYETKMIPMREMLDALKNDFEGYDTIFGELKNFKKFGNDDGYVDSFAKDIIDHFFNYLLTKKTFRGGIYGGGCSTYSRAPSYGRMVGATASGKKKGSPLIADSIAAAPGNDVNGPTALINSVLNYDQHLAKSGFVFNIKFDKKLFATDAGKKNFVSLAKAYFKNGGQQLSVNVVSADELRAAKAEPEKYKNLIVRVGGYSDYFINLTEDLKDSVIQRTGYSL